MAETFGKTNKGASEYSWGNHIIATKFQSGSAGSLESISVYIKEHGAGKVKCAIYDASLDLLANGTTEEKTVGVDYDDFLTFNFGATKPEVAASTDYYLAFYLESSDDFYYSAGAADQTGYFGQTYNGWPNSLVPDAYWTWECSIYATYEEAPPSKKTLVQATLISVVPLIVIPTLSEILKFTGG